MYDPNAIDCSNGVDRRHGTDGNLDPLLHGREPTTPEGWAVRAHQLRCRAADAAACGDHGDAWVWDGRATGAQRRAGGVWFDGVNVETRAEGA